MAEKAEQQEQYAARAVALLRQVEKDPNAVIGMKKDPALDALRDRAEFKALLGELEVKPPEMPKEW